MVRLQVASQDGEPEEMSELRHQEIQRKETKGAKDMICKGCSNVRMRGDFVRCRYWGKIVAVWGMGFQWKEIEECTARDKEPEA